jgi:nitrate/nitrite-specific signal transduction histidine kinase
MGIKKTLGCFLLSPFIISSFLLADSKIFNTPSVEMKAKMISIAGKQRMLSQRIAKNYFYMGDGLNTIKASKQLKDSLIAFERTQKKLTLAIDDKDIKNLIYFVDISLDEFKTIIKGRYSRDNGILVLDLSESMLEGSDYVVKALTKGVVSNHIIDISGKERMLSQRIAKYYMAYQNGIKDDNTIYQMKDSVREFNDILKELLAYKGNTKEIQKELESVDVMWGVVNKFYLNIQKGGLPKIVYLTTDNITQKMDKIVNLYVKTLKKGK